MMTHEEASDLLAAFALGAVVGSEYGLIAEHLASCLRCRAEVDAHREVAAALGTSVEPLPGSLWRTISGRLTTRGSGEGPPTPAPLRVARADHGGQRHGRMRAVRSSRGRMATGASVAIGFATVATVLGIRLADADDQVAHLQGAIDETARTEVVAALETAGHKTVALIDAHHRDVMQFVVRPNGRGYLVTSRLPALSSGETYQLWGIIHGKTISLGLLGRTPHLAVFTAAGSLRPHALGVSIEAGSGARQPSGSMLAYGVPH